MIRSRDLSEVQRHRVAVGASIGALIGVLLGLLGAGSADKLLIAGVIGAGAGALFGGFFARFVRIEPFEPPTIERSYVGAHAPDDDGAGRGSIRHAR